MLEHGKYDDALLALAKGVQGIVLDVDGVLTNGGIIYSAGGDELKQFHVRDGASIKLLLETGIAVAIITGRRSEVVERRAKELGIHHLVQGAKDKASALEELCNQGFPGANLAAVGDDIQDLQLFNAPQISLCCTVSDAHPTVCEHAHFVTQRGGGQGICVEIAHLVLTAQDKWPY